MHWQSDVFSIVMLHVPFLRVVVVGGGVLSTNKYFFILNKGLTVLTAGVYH